MRFLVLGGTGYLGSKVVGKMISEGYDIYCTRRLLSDSGRLNTISDKIGWVSTSTNDISSLFDEVQFDAVINFVCNYGRGSTEDIEVIRTNTEFPLEVMSIAVSKGIKKIYNIGTSLPQYTNMYSLSKAVLDDFGYIYSEKYGISYCCFKLEMFYGFDEPSDRFIPNITRKMIRGETVEMSTGEQKRDIIFVEDVVDAIMKIIGTNLYGFNVIPVGTGIGPSVGELADYIWELTGRKSIVKKGAYKARAVEPDCIADTGKIKCYCDWAPLSWREGIERIVRKTIEEMESHYENTY